jgi:hypothetical protein
MSRFHASFLLPLLLATCAAQSPRTAEAPVAQASTDPAIIAALFPVAPPPPEAASATPAPSTPPAVDASSDPPLDEDAPASLSGAYPTVAALCAAYVAAAQKRLAEDAARDPTRAPNLSTLGCREVPSPVAFRPAGGYRSVRAVHATGPFGSDSTLVVEGPRGFSLAPVYWNVVDLDDPGCPSIIRERTVEEVRVEGAWIVIVVGGDRVTYVDTPSFPEDSGARVELVRGAVWGKADASGVAFRRYNWEMLPPLGRKVQPRGLNAKPVPWRALGWTDLTPFHVAPDGALQIQEAVTAR